MKKICSLLFAFTILLSVLSIPASAQQSSHVDMIAMDNYQTDGHGTTRSNMDMNANNYRTNATTDGNRSNWGWLGLLGLAGLFGLRSRDRERT